MEVRAGSAGPRRTIRLLLAAGGSLRGLKRIFRPFTRARCRKHLFMRCAVVLFSSSLPIFVCVDSLREKSDHRKRTETLGAVQAYPARCSSFSHYSIAPFQT